MLPHLSFFLHFFITYFLPYVSFPLRIDPLRFQARYYKRQLNLALVFVFILYCICIVFWLVNACFCRVGFSYFPYQAKRLARKNISKMTCFVSSGTSNHNSINSQLVHYHSLYISDSHDARPSPEPLVLCGAKCHTTLKCPSVPSVDSGDRRVCCWPRARAARIDL